MVLESGMAVELVVIETTEPVTVFSGTAGEMRTLKYRELSDISEQVNCAQIISLVWYKRNFSLGFFLFNHLMPVH